jgi:prolyl-tRNA editing enzyme YbaK/EbsC (Cys-tRNA(Pro) deacylase)
MIGGIGGIGRTRESDVAGAIERFRAAARVVGVDPEVRRFPEGTKTADAAARAVGCEIGQIVKSLVFMAEGSPLLALTSGANRADPRRLGSLMGDVHVRRADPEEARAATGFAIGGTPPFGHTRPVTVLMDRDLLDYGLLWAAAGTPDAVFPITPAELLRAAEAKVVDLKLEE